MSQEFQNPNDRGPRRPTILQSTGVPEAMGKLNTDGLKDRNPNKPDRPGGQETQKPQDPLQG